MNKKTLHRLLIGLGIAVFIFLATNFGLNLWLKNKLPDYIKNNSAYNVSYGHLDVDMGTGNILATKLKISSKNPNNDDVIGLDGTVDTISIGRLGIYDAIFHKRVNSSELLLIKPNLQVKLAKPIDERTGKKRNPVTFENIKIKDGNITVLKHTKQKYFAVNDLMLEVQNLQMTEESVEDKLPVVFDSYDIHGNNFFFRPDNIYAIKSSVITTKNGLMNVKDFQLIPLLTHRQFIKYYPNKRNLFDFKAKEMLFRDIILDDNRLSLNKVTFVSPNFKLYTTNAKKQPDKTFRYVVNLDDVKLDKAKMLIVRPDGNRIFASEELNMDISKLVMDENTAKGTIPFSYEKFLIRGKGINYISKSQDIKVASVALDQRSGDLRGIMIRPAGAGKTTVKLNAQRARFTVDEWELRENKLKLLANQIILEGANGSILSNGPKEPQKSPDFSGIAFPLKVKNISVRNSNISFGQADKPLTFSSLNADISNIEMNEETVKHKIPFKTGDYRLTTRNFTYRLPFYQMSAGLLKFNKGKLQLNNFALRPTVSRSQFITMIPTERDLYDITASQVSADGSWDLISDQKFLNASAVNIVGANANIFRSKVPKDDQKTKPMYSELLRSIKFPMFINTLSLKNSILTYEEDTKASDGPGKLTFSNFNLTAQNLNSGKMAGKPTNIPIDIRCTFMGASPMNVKWSFDTANMSDAFSIAGTISDLAAPRINPFIEPYLKVRASGNISALIFNFKGNKNGLNGTMNLKHQNLKVSVLKNDGDKNKVLSAIANMVVRTTSDKYPESVAVDNVKRDPTKSFFNLFWQGIQEGLKKTLIGNSIEKTEKSVRNTVAETKKTVEKGKETVENTKEQVKDATEATKKSVKKTRGAFRDIFGKKEKAGD